MSPPVRRKRALMSVAVNLMDRPSDRKISCMAAAISVICNYAHLME